MSILKELFIFTLCISQVWNTFSDKKVGGWTDMSQEQLDSLSQKLNQETNTVTAKEGKMQVVNGTNYAVILSHPDAGDCFGAFNYGMFGGPSLIQHLELAANIQQKFLSSSPGLTPCSEEQKMVIFSAFEKKDDLETDKDSKSEKSDDEISLRSDLSEDFQESEISTSHRPSGSWTEMNNNDLQNIYSKLELTESNLELISGKMQVVTGINYMLEVAEQDNVNPCILAINFTAWNPTNKLSILNKSLIETNNLLGMFNGHELCSDEIHSYQVDLSNLQFRVDPDEVKKQMNLDWEDVSETEKELLATRMNMEAHGFEIEGLPKVQTHPTTKVSMVLTNKKSEKCVFFMELNVKESMVNVLSPTTSENLNEVMAEFYSDFQPCDAEVNVFWISKLSSASSFIYLIQCFFTEEFKELSELKNETDFTEWKILNSLSVQHASSLIKAQGKHLQPIMGISKIEAGISYVFIMTDPYLNACKLYVNYSSSLGLTTYKYSKLSDVELTKKSLLNINECLDEYISEYIGLKVTVFTLI